MSTSQTPMRLIDTSVREEWIDEFGHVNIAHYLTICDEANWALWNQVNAPEDTMEQRGGHEYIILENHVSYISELALGEEIYITTQLTALDDKRLILLHHVYRASDDSLSATNEVKFLGFNLNSRRAEIWQPGVKAALEAILAAHATLAIPNSAGQGITLKRK